MRFSPRFLDEIRARLPVSQVVGRKVALKKKGREYAGLSPFKVEKTPSFFVNDAKGFYHCFASGEHGDIFKFLMLTEGLSFPEAVERLAGEAGLEMPKPEARDEAREDERDRILRLLEASAAFFEANLASAAGSEARGYLGRRGLKRDTVAAFRLGYGPNSRTALKNHLAAQGFSVADMVRSGMLIGGEDIPEPYDRFRHRVMFPIQDPRGRIIAFGGRALDPNAPAKYLNSPETPVFHKGHVLFNAHRARPRAHETGRVIAVEGYMDAVALSEAGFGESVAPLGTALTEDQVKLLWRMADEPILCFDGDSAGRKAAYRAVDTVLPHLEPGKSVCFAFLPDGLDPDDLIRQQGPEAMAAALGRTRPLVDVLFEREWARDDWSTPERRASLEKGLRELVQRIPDPSIRAHYQRALQDKLSAAWGIEPRGPWRGGDRRGSPGGRAPSQARQPARTPGRPAGGPPGRRGDYPSPAYNPSDSLRKSALVAGELAAVPYREALLIRTLVNHPWLALDHAEEVAMMPLAAPAMARLRNEILSALSLDNALDRDGLYNHLSQSGAARAIELVERSNTHRCDRFAEPDADRAEVENGWRHALALHDRQVGLRRSLDAAERAWHEDGSDEAYARICELQAELARMSLPEALDATAGDI